MKALVFDTETTDLLQNNLVPLNRQPRIIEFCGVLVDVKKKKIIDALEFLCNPGIPIPPKITQITSISDDQVREQPPFADRIKEVSAFMKKATAAVAHNMSFDHGVMEVEAARAQIKWPWPEKRICTVEVSEFVKGRRLRLNELHEHLFGEKFEGAHRARADVDALARCFLEMSGRGWI